jgi:hypothetical protein
MRVVVGSSIAALVLVDLLSKHEQVIWAKRDGGIGGVFGGVETEFGRLDIGMTNLELGDLSLSPVDSPLGEYSSESTNSCRNHLGLVRQYVEQYCVLKQLPEPQMFYRDSVLADFLYGHRLDVLNFFSFNERILSCLKSVPTNLHPSLKYLTGTALERISYIEMCKQTFGEHFTNTLIVPWMKKLGVIDVEEIMSIDHRIVWAPLYYPESLVRAITEKEFDIGLKSFFSAPHESTLASQIQSIFQELTTRENVVLREINSVNIDFVNNLISDDAISDVYIADRIQGVQTQPKQTKIDLVYFLMSETSAEFDYVLNSPSSETPWYRLTRVSLLEDGNSIVCGEFAENTIVKSPTAESLGLSRYVADFGAAEVKRLSNINALNLPDLDWDATYEFLLKGIRSSTGKINVLGPGASRWRNTFSDQVIQAHKTFGEIYEL